MCLTTLRILARCPMFARLPGTSQETVSRVLSRLSEEGIISVKGRAITILNAARLKEIAGR